MKKRYIILPIVGLLVVAAGCLAYWQRNNLEALYYLKTMKPDTLQEKIDENENVLKDALKDNNLTDITVTQEDLDKIASGEMTAEDIAKKIVDGQGGGIGGTSGTDGTGSGDGTDGTGGTSATGGTSGTGGGQSPNPSTSPAPSQGSSMTAEESAAALRTQVASMYVLKASFVSQLEAIVQSAKEEYSALPADQRTTQKKTDIVYAKASDLSTLERECDSEVAKVVAETRRLLKESGGDTSLADKLAQTYEQEKSLKKAYYINEMNS